MINWSKVLAAEVKAKGKRLGSIAGPLTMDEFTIWRYQGHTVMICEVGDEFSLGPHICTVLQGERIVWLDPVASAGAAILAARGK